MAFRAENTPAPQRNTKPEQPLRSVVDAVLNPPDTHIWGVYGCLVVLSIIELYSASSFEISKQGLYAPLIRHAGMLFAGFLIILGLQKVHYKYFVPASRLLCIASALAMIYVLFFGEVINGARRSISLPFMTLYPAEFLKLSAILMLALILSTTQLKKDERLRNRGLIKAASLVIFLSGLLFTQGLTNTMILMAVSCSMLLLGALEWRKFFMIIGVYAIVGCAAFAVKSYIADQAQKDVKVEVLVDSRGNTFEIPEVANSGASTRMAGNTWGNRMEAFSDDTPRYERPITTKNLQEMRSYMAQANGGWLGVFPGNSRETSRLPLAFSDYIFAIIVEDIGFIGGMVLMILYLWLLARAYVIAHRCNQMYPAFLVTGCAVLITMQALCHMAIVTGAGPVSGQPLPLFSKGGTSILTTSIAFGIMLSVSRFTVRNKEASSAELAREKNALPTELQDANPSQF